MKKIFNKCLSANDVGATGGHQGGILIPKTEVEFLEFLPTLDSTIKNPDAWIECVDDKGIPRRFRFVYYNNRLHDPQGTRNEYRVTYMTSYFREIGASEGDTFEISRNDGDLHYKIRIISRSVAPVAPSSPEDGPIRIKIKSSWNRLH